jgi:beta-lactamase regulating signal transducer with metallopeptidase domain
MLMPVLWWLAETTVVAGLLAGIAAGLGRWRRMDASTRHLLWLLVLVKLVLPPFFRAPWSLPVPASVAGWLRAPEPRPALAGPIPSRAVARPADLPEAIEAPAEPDFRAVLASLEAAPEVAPELTPATIEPAAAIEDPTASPDAPEPAPLSFPAWPLHRWLLVVWGGVALGLVVRETVRIVRFRGRLRQAVPAPEWLVAEAEQLAARLDVHPPELLVVPGLGTPLLWCLGRPRLLVPGYLIKSIDAARWRGILAHELAHLRRGDHWVGRLELAAGLVWWWNPVYWVARRRIDAEAELACDAWVVQVLPDDRLNYAEVLLQICSKFSLAGSPSPALGVAGSGRFFERRLRMLLDDQVPRRRPLPLLLAIFALALLAVPSWTQSSSAALIPMEPKALPAVSEQPAGPSDAQADDDDDGDDDQDKAKDKAKADDDDDDRDKAKADDDDDDDKADADDDDDDKDKDADRDRKQSSARKHSSGRDESSKSKGKDRDDDVEDVEVDIKAALGPDFEKKMEAFGKEMEKKFGEHSEFAKKMEAFGKEMEAKFGPGSEFAKKMEAFGKEMEKKFGDGSEFAKKMELLGKDMEKKFGPGSEFAKKMEEKFGEHSEFAKKMEEAAGQLEKKAKEQKELKVKQKSRADDEARHRADKESADREQSRKARVKALEEKIEQLMRELKELKAAEREEAERY